MGMRILILLVYTALKIKYNMQGMFMAGTGLPFIANTHWTTQWKPRLALSMINSNFVKNKSAGTQRNLMFSSESVKRP